MIQTAGAIGGIAASLVRVPTEVCNHYIFTCSIQLVLCCAQILSHCIQVVKQRMQTGQFKSAPNAVRLIVAKQGFKGLYAVCIFWHLIWDHLLTCNTNFYLNSESLLILYVLIMPHLL